MLMFLAWVAGILACAIFAATVFGLVFEAARERVIREGAAPFTKRMLRWALLLAALCALIGVAALLAEAGVSYQEVEP